MICICRVDVERGGEVLKVPKVFGVLKVPKVLQVFKVLETAQQIRKLQTFYFV